MLNNPVRHHFVPQCYLRRFVNERDKLWVLPKDKRSPFLSSTKNIAVRKHYYSFEDAEGERDVRFEKVFSGIEGRAEPVLRSIAAREDITKAGKDVLADFLGLMWSRIPNFRDSVQAGIAFFLEHFKNVLFESEFGIDKLIESAPAILDNFEGSKETFSEYLRAQVKVDVDEKESLKYMDIGIDIANAMKEMHWRFWFIDGKNDIFITSDNPCYVTSKILDKTPYGAGIALKGASFHFPISQKVFLTGDWNGSHIEYKAISSRKQLTRINSRTIRYAEAEVYSPVADARLLSLHERSKNFALLTLFDAAGPYFIRRKLAKRAR